MGIEFNFDFAGLWNSLLNFSTQDPLTIFLRIFLHGGWVVFLLLALKPFYYAWLDARQTLYTKRWKFVFLAIDIPKNNEQTPKAVENFFIGLAGAHAAINLWDKYWVGKVQESFSFEIASLEGYIQFIVQTPVHFRDLVEAAIYAQYPDAEITEVDDYTKPFADVKFPNDKYNLWGTEFVLTKDFPYPIRLYSEFEHSLTQSFLDPMASLLEVMTRMGKGEQLWFQIIVTPQAAGWGEKAKQVVKTMMGQEYHAPQSATAKALNVPIKWIDQIGGLVGSLTTSGEADFKKEDSKDMFKMFNMSPGERVALEGVQKKLAKRAFRVKLRYLYMGEKEVFNKGRGVSAMVGAVNQFSTTDVNGFKPGGKTKTQANYFFVRYRMATRQNKILKRFRNRDSYNGEPVGNMFLNTEELASIWHFPVMTVKASTLERTVSKRAVSPSRLPVVLSDTRETVTRARADSTSKKSASPRSLERPSGPALPEANNKNVPAVLPEAETSRKPAPPPNLPTI